MTTEQFTYWLKEFVDKMPNSVFSEKELKTIKNKMKKVKGTIVEKKENGILSC